MRKKLLDQNTTPLYDALKKYTENGTIPFHVPGHKQGRGNKALKNILGTACLDLDLACMEDLDNICNPVSVIKEAEELAAELYGADNAFFLVNGTTSGIQAMIMSVCEPGEKILIPRNAHKSAIGGIVLSGAKPVYIKPEINEFYGIAMGVTPETVAEALKTYPDVKAVFLINPTYYGIASNLRQIVRICHSFDVPVIVDEAHGAHLPFNRKLPLSAMEAGADLAASSTHKLGGSLTQSSMLFHRGSLVNPDKVKAILNLTQTTSPSYLLMVSLDIARQQMALYGKKEIAKIYNLALEAREQIRSIPGLHLLGEEVLNSAGSYALDPTKIVINVKGLGLSGYDAEKILRKQYKIQVELSDLLNVLLLITIGDDKKTVSCLVSALKDMAEGQSKKNVVKYFIPPPSLPDAVISPREAFYAETKTIPLQKAVGEISAEMIMSYPPGIPIVCPGERITQEIVDYVNILQNEDAELQGTEDPAVKNIKVLAKRLVLIQNEENISQQVI